jgi:UDP-N-acetylglucosamine 2-epimerase (non-hydrolysing)
MKILIVFGTRPEAIKMAPLIKVLKESNKHEVIVCLTGQHREMLTQLLPFFGIEADFNLDVMRPGQDLFDVTSTVILGMRSVISQVSPELILVHGDTTTAMAAALSGFYMKISVGHVEAGLRTYDTMSPYPEELNRQMLSRIAKYHFSPTAASRYNLIKEGVADANIFVTGNTVVDALFWAVQRITADKEFREFHVKDLNRVLGCDWQSSRIVLITGHRRENHGSGLENICKAIARLANDYTDTLFVYPVHMNPSVRNSVVNNLDGIKNVKLTDPLGYVPFVILLMQCHIVLTDSGGIQEEAPSLGKPVLVMREVTERPEGLAAGTVKLVGTDVDEIVFNVSNLIDDPEVYNSMAKSRNPYGDGCAAQKILQVINAIS